MDRILSPPPNFYVDTLTPNVTFLKIGLFKEVIKVKGIHKGGALIQYD